VGPFGGGESRSVSFVLMGGFFCKKWQIAMLQA
jgi:hypothetical protein